MAFDFDKDTDSVTSSRTSAGTGAGAGAVPIRTAIIGGGVAGLTAAGTALRRGEEVTVFEHSRATALKLGITGKGRCNLTNNCTVDEFLANVPTNPRFLYASLTAFPPSAVMELFESLGVPLKTERGRRVFPESDRALDIVAALRRYASGAKIITASIEGLTLNGGGSQVVALTASDGRKFTGFDRYIVATGGLSYPATGSRGAGYELARMAGHTVTPLRASLVPLTAEGNLAPSLMGLSLKNVAVAFTPVISGGGKPPKPVYTDFGELLFTHFGVSGPVVLSASAYLRGLPDTKYTLSIDLKPALDESALDARLLSDFSDNINRDFINSLSALLPAKLIEPFVSLSGIDPRRKVNTVTRQERRDLVYLLKHLTLTINGTRPVAEAVITSGGVSVKELDPRTMRSKLVSNLYFAGEVIDVDAYTGGYNLQIAFSTGYCAGGAGDARDTLLS